MLNPAIVLVNICKTDSADHTACIEFSYDDLDRFLVVETRYLEGDKFKANRNNIEMYGQVIRFSNCWDEWPGLMWDQYEMPVGYALALINLLKQNRWSCTEGLSDIASHWDDQHEKITWRDIGHTQEIFEPVINPNQLKIAFKA